jgi:UDP-N-acetylmuramoyl-L-alanyl-D-glutamate--2,6-diaminopimelate ligase
MNAKVIVSSATVDTKLTLQALQQRLGAVGAKLVGDPELTVCDVFQDSRRVTAGALFAARAGGKLDGLSFWHDAERNGAVALLREAGLDGVQAVPGIEVADVRRAIGVAAEAVYGDPSTKLKLVGVTGTNGKTTTAWLSEHALNRAGARAARLGTLGYSFEAQQLAGSLTTPEADDISRYAARVLASGASHLVMEVSSHALAQARVDALRFEVAAFTNLTQDHLDFHPTMEAYAASKRRLFDELSPAHRVINIDDDFGRRLAEQLGAVTVSCQRRADVWATGVTSDEAGIRATVHVAERSYALRSRLVGLFNVDNILLTLGIVFALGLDVESALLALAGSSGVPGRFERCDRPEDDIQVLVDYAHTPGALARVLAEARRMTQANLVCVFGCGGDRDAGKRPEMGAVVGQWASHAIVTNDNPRSEDPESIADGIVAGLADKGSTFEVMLDRASAIDTAIMQAKPGDVVLIAGKGHEPYQLVGDRTLAFDDRDEARAALSKRRGEPG